MPRLEFVLTFNVLTFNVLTFNVLTRKPMRLSVVIPALNEAGRIARTLAAVRAQSGFDEVIVADGGSVDATRRIAEPFARVILAPRGRALQMNAGAASATGDVLFFLHADTLPPPDGAVAIRRALADPGIEAGAFRLRFDRASPLLAFYGFCTRLPWWRICFGDRGLFVRRRAFEALGGFPETPMFEDLEMVRRLHRRGGFRFLPQPVVTAARRFDETGVLRQQLLNLRLWSHHLRGTDPRRLVHLYRYDTLER